MRRFKPKRKMRYSRRHKRSSFKKRRGSAGKIRIGYRW